jgi:hypothetical protein
MNMGDLLQQCHPLIPHLITPIDYIIEVIALPSALSDSLKDSTHPSTFPDLGKSKNYLSAQYILKKGFSWVHDNT